jgi:hypothetical protein
MQQMGGTIITVATVTKDSHCMVFLFFAEGRDWNAN